MATNPLDIINLAQARVGLQQVGDDAAHDALITSYVKAAIQAVDDMTQIGVLARRITISCAIAALTDQIRIVAPARALVRDVMYRPWDDAPITGMANLSATQVATLPTGETFLSPPAAGWPYERLVLSWIIDIPVSRLPGAIIGASMLLLQDLADATETIVPMSWPVRQLLIPYKNSSVEWGDDEYSLSVPQVDETPDPVVPVDPIQPPASGIRLRCCWTAGTDVTATDLAAGSESQGSVIVVPDADGAHYLNIWRSDAAGGNPMSVMISGGGDSRNLFGGAVDLEDLAGTDGKLIQTVARQQATLLSGVNVIVG